MLFLLIITGLTSGANAFATGCSDLLRDGVRNELSTTGSDAYEGQFHSLMCDSTLEVTEITSSSSGGASFGFGSLSLGGSKAKAQLFKETYEHLACSQFSSELTTLQESTLQSSIIDSNIVDAFVQCKALEAQGLVVEVDASPTNEKVVIFNIRFEGDPNGETINGYSILPGYAATCDDTNFKPGPLDVDTYYLNCVRNESVLEGYTIRLHTSEGNYTHHQKAIPGVRTLTDIENSIALLQSSTTRLELDTSQLESHTAQLQADSKQWPDGKYCIFQAGGFCPSGFTAKSGHLRALHMYSTNSWYVGPVVFGDSQIKCHGSYCGRYGRWAADLTIKACCK